MVLRFADVCALAQRPKSQIKHFRALNAKMTHEMAVLIRMKFPATSERLGPAQKRQLEETLDEGLQAMDHEIGKLKLLASK